MRIPLPFAHHAPTQDQLDRAFERTREDLQRLKAIVEDLGLSENPHALYTAAQLYETHRQMLVSVDTGAHMQAHDERVQELVRLEGFDLLTLDPSDSNYRAMMEISFLSDEELDRRLEIARNRASVKSVGEVVTLPKYAPLDDNAEG